MSQVPDAAEPMGTPTAPVPATARGAALSGPVRFALSAAFAFLFVLGGAITAFSHNDFFYLGSASRSGVLYQDLHYVQAPLSYWFWRAVHLLAPEGDSYVAMRLVSAALVAFAIAWMTTATRLSALQRAAFLLLATSSYYVVCIGYEIGNYSLGLALSCVGIACVLSEGRHRYPLAGIAFGLATAAKINCLLLLLPALVAIRMDEERIGRRRTDAAWLVAGFLAGNALSLYYFASNPWSFYFHNVAFHSELTNSARGLGTLTSLSAVAGGLRRFLEAYSAEVALLAVVLLSSLGTPRLRRRIGPDLLADWRLRGTAERRRALTLLAFLAVSLVMAASPMIMYDQYLSLSGLLILFSLVSLVGGLDPALSRNLLLGLAAIGLFRLLLFVPAVAENIKDGHLVFAEHRRMVAALDEAVARHAVLGPGCEPEVFTLAGSIVADSSLRLSPYTEGGIFWSRLRGFVPERYAEDPRFGFDPLLVDPEGFLAADGAAFVLTGYYDESAFENAFERSASAMGFVEVGLGPFLGREMSLFIRSRCYR